jgi:hypothetical protein
MFMIDGGTNTFCVAGSPSAVGRSGAGDLAVVAAGAGATRVRSAAAFSRRRALTTVARHWGARELTVVAAGGGALGSSWLWRILAAVLSWTRGVPERELAAVAAPSPEKREADGTRKVSWR